MISILLPTYQAAASLSRSIKSILAQTFTGFELLVLDDGSTDDTERTVLQFRDERVRYLRLPHGGISAALNEGIRQARYDILARMDAGDIAFPERLQRQYDVLKGSPATTIVSCRYAIFEWGSIRYLVQGSADPLLIKQRLALHPDFPHQGVMVRKEFIVTAGMYRDVPLEDYDLWLRVRKTAEFRVVPEILMLIEHTGGSLTNRNVTKRYRDAYTLQQPYYQDLSTFGITEADQVAVMKGWREYFYGTRTRAMNEWSRLGIRILRYPALLSALLVMLLPGRSFVHFKEQRLRQRLSYYLQYFGSAAVRSRNELRRCVSRAEGG